MFFIGVITNQKNEEYVKKELSEIVPVDNIIFINDRNITNIKNIKFKVIIIDSKINNKIELRKIISGTRVILLNSDIQMDYEILNDLDLTIITYGFNLKSTFTVSSIEDNRIIICLQRNIYNNKNMEIEPQEFNIYRNENIEKYIVIAMFIVKTFYK